MDVKNIFANLSKSQKELIENIVNNENCKIERITSRNSKTRENEWHNQDKNEFVLVLRGSAELSFFPNEKVKMEEGDYLIIPARLKHRVEKTDKETIWLTVFY